MLSNISYQIKQLIFFILLFKAHAQPPFASIHHQIKHELQHHQPYQHQYHHQKQHEYQQLQQQHQQQNLIDSTLIAEEEHHPKELKIRTGKIPSLSLITFDIHNLKYPDDEKLNSEGLKFLTTSTKTKSNANIKTNQYENNKNIERLQNQPSASASSSSSLESTGETIKQLKHSHQQKREVILADIPFWSLQFNDPANNNSHNYKDETSLSPSSSSSSSTTQSIFDYTYYKPVEDFDNDENFPSTETSENEVNQIFNPKEIPFLKEYQKHKRPSLSPSSSSSQLLSKKSNKPKFIIGPEDGIIDGGGIVDGNDVDVNGNKKMKFNIKSYPLFQNERFKVTKKFPYNFYNRNNDNVEDYDGNDNYDGDDNIYNSNNNNNNNNNKNNQYSNNLNDDSNGEYRVIFNNKRITPPPVWMKMLRNRKDGRKPWALVDRKQEIGGGNTVGGGGVGVGVSTGVSNNRVRYFNEPDTRIHSMPDFKRQKLKIHQTQFVPSISVGAMTNLGDFFDNLRNNVDYMEKGNFNSDAVDLMEGDHLNKISEHLKTESMDAGGGQTKPTGTAAFLHAIRTYRPSQKVRSLVSMTPEGYHGHGTHFSDPNYMWMGLGK